MLSMMKQPNSHYCFVCGVANPCGLHLTFYASGPGESTAHYTVPEQYQGYPGVVHGGVVAAMLDEAAGRSHMGIDPQKPRFMYTAKLEIRYRKNVPVGQPLRVVGRAGSTKGKLATATSAIYDQAGVLLAEADALLVDVPADTLNGINLEEIGWKVYDS